MRDLLKYHQNRIPLTEQEIREKAPSVYAEEPSGHVSEKYTFIPTTQVIQIWRNWVGEYTRQNNVVREQELEIIILNTYFVSVTIGWMILWDVVLKLL